MSTWVGWIISPIFVVFIGFLIWVLGKKNRDEIYLKNKFTNKIQNLHKLKLKYNNNNNKLISFSLGGYTISTFEAIKDDFTYPEVKEINELINFFISIFQKYVDNNSNSLLKKDIRKKLNLSLVKYKKYFIQFIDSYLKFKEKKYEFFDYKNTFQIVFQLFSLKNNFSNPIWKMDLNRDVELIFENISNLNKNELLSKLEELVCIEVQYFEEYISYKTIVEVWGSPNSKKIKLDILKNPFSEFLSQKNMETSFNKSIKGFDHEIKDIIGFDIKLKLECNCNNHNFDFWTPTGNKVTINKNTYYQFVNNNHIFKFIKDYKVFFNCIEIPTKNCELLFIDSNNNILSIENLKYELNNIKNTKIHEEKLIEYRIFLEELNLL